MKGKSVQHVIKRLVIEILTATFNAENAIDVNQYERERVQQQNIEIGIRFSNTGKIP